MICEEKPWTCRLVFHDSELFWRSLRWEAEAASCGGSGRRATGVREVQVWPRHVRSAGCLALKGKDIFKCMKKNRSADVLTLSENYFYLEDHLCQHYHNLRNFPSRSASVSFTTFLHHYHPHCLSVTLQCHHHHHRHHHHTTVTYLPYLQTRPGLPPARIFTFQLASHPISSVKVDFYLKNFDTYFWWGFVVTFNFIVVCYFMHNVWF